MTTREALFVRQSIEIQAPASRIWHVLTHRELTQQWVSEFFGQPAELVSDWKPGSPVEWKMLADGKTYVEGKVAAIEPYTLLRYTVFDVRSQRPPVSDEDGITFTLAEQGGKTLISLRQGDFGKMDDGRKYYEASVAVWEKVMPKIKTAAEAI
jgi:uncharacterized protein YndB with AHSA1/START domain